MKKLFIGFICGCFLSFTTVVFASDSVKAIISPVKFFFNSSEKSLDADYNALNYNGHVYVPIRFVAENMGASVNYNEQNSEVSVDYATAAGFPLRDPYVDIIRLGNLNVTTDGNQSTVTGQVKMTEDFADGDDFGFSLSFYNDQGEKIGNVSPGSSIHMNPGEIRSFELTGDGDFSKYAAVSFWGANVKAGPSRTGFPPRNLNIIDPKKPEVNLGDLRIDTIGNFSRVVGHLQVDGPLSDVDAFLKFYSSTGEVIGEAHLKDKAGGGGVSSFEAIGKGDLSTYKEVKLIVNNISPIN